METVKIVITTEEEMINLGKVIGSLAYPNMIITMNGDLGAGKTTMTKGIGSELGIRRTINSPTFTIMVKTQSSEISKELADLSFTNIKARYGFSSFPRYDAPPYVAYVTEERENASGEIFIILSGMDTELTFDVAKLSPISFTGSPLYTEGMMTCESLQLPYPVRI